MTAQSRLDSEIAVVILSFNRAEELLRTVAHTVALPERPRVIVVDNGSTDGSAQLVAKRFPWVRVIALPRNVGAAARNIGAIMAGTQYVAFSDDDTLWTGGSLQAAVKILREHPRVGVISARILVGARKEDPASRAMASSPLPSAGYPGRVVIGFMAGACVFRRCAFQESGGYEPKLFIGGEEALLALDLATRGWAMLYSDALIVFHYPSNYRDAAARTRLLTRNAIWVGWLRRHYMSAAHQTVRALVRGARDRSVRRGCIDALKDMHWVMQQRRTVPAHVESSWLQIERWLARDAKASRT